MNSLLRFCTLLVFVVILNAGQALTRVSVIPTDGTQADFLKAYKYALYKSNLDYRFTNSTMDSALFPKYGEFSVYWASSGNDKGAFISPDIMESEFAPVTRNEAEGYNWQGVNHYSIQFKSNPKKIAIFRSSIKVNGASVSWEAPYFKNLFDTYLYDNIYYYINEAELLKDGINAATDLLIIPSLNANGSNTIFYIDSIFSANPAIKDKLLNFLARGGMVYTEGNGAHFLSKIGLIPYTKDDYKNMVQPLAQSGSLTLEFNNNCNHPAGFSSAVAGNQLYSTSIPRLDVTGAEIIAYEKSSGAPIVFALSAGKANGGRVVCNLGLPAVGGLNRIKQGSRQLQWTLDAILFAFAKKIDVTRSVYNDLYNKLSVGRNAVSYDGRDTFEIRIKVRNLGGESLTNISIIESIRTYFSFVDVVTQGVTYNFNNGNLIINNISLGPKSEQEIIYRLATPERNDVIHEQVDKYISWSTYIYASYLSLNYYDSEGKHTYNKYRNYADVVFSAELAADADLNWKNFLGLYYQPFKVFMIMENKGRTNAEETIYTQYIPKDVPFYGVDHSLQIPILKTPGGKFIDVLRGSNDQSVPDYDMDSDGKPDAWLDTASIYPKGYSLTEEEVYWLNPWEHLKTGNSFLYEDIDHDGLRAQDTDGDGIVDIEEPGDKIRVWKVTWKIGRVPGKQFYDPYCYYEIWVDPPDLVPMSAGVGYANGKLDGKVNGMFYPYSGDIENPNLSDTSWAHWMERDKIGNVVWKQLIWQRINNYEGFTFIDTLKENYRLKPTDKCAGTVPQPSREFIAVLSLGGEEIDMFHPTPQNSLYSKLDYKTIFGENRVSPIRTTYTYYAPLPNPLQFEYLTNNFTITDTTGNETLQFLPSTGKARLVFDVDASTEYTYYWIRNVGYDVDYNDPSEKIEGQEKLGDGVFGYMLYDIPKGMGGYKITLPKKEDGSYDIDKIVEVDGKPFSKWIDNKNTGNTVEIWETPYQYQIYVPQLLIPPALDDDNHDGIDDWIDDRGDRFCSSTGFLHDPFMLDNGEKWRDYPLTPFRDDIYGMVDSGWYCGADNTYGDDFFENLGKTHFKFRVNYEGLGKEGPVDISKGGWLVVEEIFGGSPWVLFSHSLSGYAKGTDYTLTSTASPSAARFGIDTVFVKHKITDKNEPHLFDHNFDPYHVSYGFGESTVTTYAGDKDPCSLIVPDITMPAIIDPGQDNFNVTLIPGADANNPDLKDYPKQVSGTLLEVRIEVSNGTDDNWINTKIEPVLPADLGNTSLVMSYVAYPRPLVPAKVDPVTGEIIQGGDDIGSFRAGWRFNQPEGEVLIKLGTNLPLMQPSRRAYYIYLFRIDETLANGVYNIGFKMDGTRKHYDGVNKGKIAYEVPPANFSITDKDANGNIANFQKIVVGTGDLKSLTSKVSPYFTGLDEAKWSKTDVNYLDFDKMNNNLPTVFDENTKLEAIDMSQFKNFPSVELPSVYILEKGELNSYKALNDPTDDIPLTELSSLIYDNDAFKNLSVKSASVKATVSGPKIYTAKKIENVNGEKAGLRGTYFWESKEEVISVGIMLEVSNQGSDIAENVELLVKSGHYFYPDTSGLTNCSAIQGKDIAFSLGTLLPGETRKVPYNYLKTPDVCSFIYDTSDAVNEIAVTYMGRGVKVKDGVEPFRFMDTDILGFPAEDIRLESITADRDKLVKGEPVNLTINCRNGMANSNNVNVGLYAVIVRDSAFDGRPDTVKIAENLFESMEKFKEYRFSVPFAVPSDAGFVEFFAIVDSGLSHCEFCKSNNQLSYVVPFKEPEWIVNTEAYPNPFDYRATITYTLPKHCNSIEIVFYSADGKEIGKLANCPAGMGLHNVEWFVPDLAKGVYYFSINGITEDGSHRRHLCRVVKEK